jgi:hypothetical protein
MMSLKQTSFLPVFPHTEPATLIPYRIRSYKMETKSKHGKMSDFPALVIIYPVYQPGGSVGIQLALFFRVFL